AKYDNRATLYVPLEAGHAAQNVLLAAAEADIGAVEIGGFFEDRLAAELGHHPRLTPLPTLVFRAIPSSLDRERAHQPAMGFRWADTQIAGYTPPYCIGAARAEGADVGWAWGRDSDPALAHDKALAEAQERLGCILPTGLYEARYSDLANAVAPADIVAYD